MGNEISLSVQLAVNNGSLKDNQSISISAEQIGDRSSPGEQEIGFTHELLGIRTDITLGLAIFQNLSANLYIDIGIVHSSTFVPTDRLLAGEPLLKRLVPGTSYYARAETSEYYAGAELKWLVLED